jgi:hypothetical protein
MRMWGFIVAGRLDNTIEGDEFGNYNFSHDLFFINQTEEEMTLIG